MNSLLLLEDVPSEEVLLVGSDDQYELDEYHSLELLLS